MECNNENLIGREQLENTNHDEVLEGNKRFGVIKNNDELKERECIDGKNNDDVLIKALKELEVYDNPGGKHAVVIHNNSNSNGMDKGRKLDKRGRSKKVTILATRGNKGTTEKTKELMKCDIEGLYEKNKNMEFLVEGSTGMDLNSGRFSNSNSSQLEDAMRASKGSDLNGGTGLHSSDEKKDHNDDPSHHITRPPDEEKKLQEIEGS